MERKVERKIGKYKYRKNDGGIWEWHKEKGLLKYLYITILSQ